MTTVRFLRQLPLLAVAVFLPSCKKGASENASNGLLLGSNIVHVASLPHYLARLRLADFAEHGCRIASAQLRWIILALGVLGVFSVAITITNCSPVTTFWACRDSGTYPAGLIALEECGDGLMNIDRGTIQLDKVARLVFLCSNEAKAQQARGKWRLILAENASVTDMMVPDGTSRSGLDEPKPAVGSPPGPGVAKASSALSEGLVLQTRSSGTYKGVETRFSGREFISRLGKRSESMMQGGPANQKMVTLQRADTPTKTFIIDDSSRSYTEVDLVALQELNRTENATGLDSTRYTVERLGHENILGYEADHVMVKEKTRRSEGEATFEIWAARELASSEEFRGMSFPQGAGNDAEAFEKALKAAGADGLVLKLIHTSSYGMKYTQEVEKIEKRNLAPEMFGIPAGYTRSVNLMDMMVMGGTSRPHTDEAALTKPAQPTPGTRVESTPLGPALTNTEIIRMQRVGPFPNRILGKAMSCDGRHVALATSLGRSVIVEIDGQGGARYDGIQPGTFVFSPDCRRLAHAAGKGQKCFMVVDGQPGPEYDGIVDSTVFSPDSRRLAYAAKQGQKWFVVLDGQAGPAYDGIVTDTLVFSPDSKHVAYGAIESEKQFVVLDGQAGPAYGGIGNKRVVFSPDSSRLAYAAQNGRMRLVVLGDKAEAEYHDVTAPVFSPNSEHVAYGAQKGMKWFLVLDGRPGLEQDGTMPGTLLMPGTPVFSPDSKRIAYWVKKGQKLIVAVDGQTGPEYDAAPGTLVFSPDSKRLAYAAGKDQKCFMVVDGQAGLEYDSLPLHTFVFSPDSKHAAYGASHGGKQFVVLDSKTGPEYDWIRMPVFSSDSKHVAYAASDGRKQFVVLDGQTGPEHDGIVMFEPGKLTFGADGGLEYLAVKDGSLYRVIHAANNSTVR
jgi:hypothetical protein